MKVFKFRDIKFLAEDKGGVYSFLAKYKGRNIVFKSTDETLFEDIDSNPRRSKAARTYIYEKIKYLYFSGHNKDVIVGDYYECIEDVVMDDDSISYIKGKRYRSDMSGCITDERGCESHLWDEECGLNKYFIHVQD